MFALNITDHPDGRGAQVGLVAKRTYRVSAGRCVVAEEQVPLVELPETNDDRSVLLHDMDTVLNRRQADIVVTGKIRALRKERRLDVHVRVGSLSRRLRAFGDRRCLRGSDGRLRFSDPDPIEEIDVGWTAAYGGVDEVARKKYGDPIEGFCKDARQPYNPRFGLFAYPRNRAGKGYLIELSDEALDGCMLPNLEDPQHLLIPERLATGRPDRWPLAAPVASLGWLSYNCFPRSAMVGMVPPFDPVACPPASFSEVVSGILNPRSIAPQVALSHRFDLAAAQQSAIGMRTSELFPGAPVELTNLHPSLPSWTFALPREVPSMALQMPDQRAVALQPAIRTVLLDPDRDRVCITWVGEQRDPTPVGPGRMKQIRHGIRWNG
ncbi:MAG TPA: DUF2169 domain-containing protein [Polyangia bacterium]|nr:DUF2169 domain-containing protein [Polyangia bacterium]